MRQKWLWIASVMAVACLPLVAGAAVNNTHHDMSVYIGGTQAFTCYYCHGIKDSAVADQGLGTVGNLCYNRCHSGTGIAGAGTGGLVPAGPLEGDLDGVAVGTRTTGINVLSLSHGYALSIPAPDLDTSVTGSNFPHTSGFPGVRLECTSCHNVHGNQFAPFLNKPMADNDATFANTDTVCTTCHAGNTAATANLRYALITSLRAAQGGHVIEVALNNANATGRTGEGRHARVMALKGTVLDTPTATGAALNAPATHYDTGGHLVNDDGTITATPTDPGTTGGRVGCYTCHSAHMDTGKTNQLVIIKDNGPQNPVAGSQTAPLCVACHGPGPAPGATTSRNNPGNTAYYHPANSEAITPYQHSFTYWGTAGTFSIVVDTGALPAQTPIGDTGAITCVTCHDVHGGMAGQMAIRNLGQAAGAVVCNGCHKGGEGPGTARNSHHLTGTANYVTGTWGFTNPSWAGAAGSPGDLADGLACQDCHVFNGTAHNW